MTDRVLQSREHPMIKRMRTRTYRQDNCEPDDVLTKAWAWRLAKRFEFCVGWFHGPLPSLTYFNPTGRAHPGAVAMTLRVWRAMIGWRWYSSNRINP